MKSQKNLVQFPKISIITPSFNQGKFIERTIKSVLNQNYSNFEYIVIDGGSTDETISILKKYNDKLTWISEPDSGQTSAINKGLRMSLGNIIAYLNSDDTYEPHTLKIISKYFADHPKTYFVYGEGRLIDCDDNEIGFYNTKTADYQSLASHCPISQPTTFMKRKIYEEIGEFNESYQFTMDYEYWIRVSKKFKLHYLKKLILANARIHDDAKTSAFTSKLHLDAIKATKSFYDEVHPDWINNYINSFFARKESNILYYPIMIVGSFLLTMYWNKRFPNNTQYQQYVTWIKDFFKQYF